MAEIGEWKKKVYETHEVQVQVRQRSQSEWSYTVRVCRPGTNIRAAGTLTEPRASPSTTNRARPRKWPGLRTASGWPSSWPERLRVELRLAGRRPCRAPVRLPFHSRLAVIR